MTCWCGAQGAYLCPVDPAVTPWDGVTRTDDGEPAMPYCPAHVRDGYAPLAADADDDATPVSRDHVTHLGVDCAEYVNGDAVAVLYGDVTCGTCRADARRLA